ncbi:MAG: CvpA family protein [Patescibacteria group bacterium]|jgi:uncharacterized membrane protein required for colicin V production
MSGFDIILILIIAGFAFYGLFNGLIKTVGAIVALVLGVWIASFFYLPIYSLAEKLFFGFESLGRAVIFMVLFIITNRLINFFFILVEGSYNSLFFIPFLKSINRLLGAIFGLVLGGLIIGLALYGLNQVGLGTKLLAGYVKTSKIAPILLKYAGLIVPLLPNLWEKIKSFGDDKSAGLKNIDFKGIDTDNFNIEKLKDTGGYLKEKVWNGSK